MKWFANMKIGKKLVLSFIIIALIWGAMGVYAIYNLQEVQRAGEDLYENMTVPLSEINGIATYFQGISVDLRDLTLARTPEEMEIEVASIAEKRSGIEDLTRKFGDSLLTDDETEAFRASEAARTTFRAESDKVIAFARAGMVDNVILMLREDGSVGKAALEYQEAVNQLINMKVEDARLKAKTNTENAERASIVLAAVIVFVVLLSILTGLVISSVITRPLKKAVHMIEEMSLGHFGNRLNIDTKDEIGQMAKAMDFFAEELQTKVIGAMSLISQGDVSMEIIPNDEQDEISPALKKTVETIRELNTEVQLLIQAATEGKLDVRGDSSGYSGAWNEMITGINGLIDAFVTPIHLTAEFVEQISRGEIPPVITDDYLGDFNEIKDNINICIAVMNNLLGETNMLIQAVQEGKLDVKGDAALFSGEWGSMVQGVNDLIDAFVAPINMTAEYVDRISKGDIPSRITDVYYGDFNEIKMSINGCIDVMNGLLGETNKLINAAQEGKLDIRANGERFVGDWGTLMTGINHLVDAFVTPINMTAEYVDRISKGDIPAKITDIYHGDFNVIKNNLNHCIDIMSGLQRETNSLIHAAQEGRLDERADVSGFAGGWEELVGGFNRLLEAVAEPIKEVTAVMNEISEGNLKVSVTGDYRGEFGVLSNAVNNTAMDLNAVIGEISEVIGAISEGNLAIEQVREFKGDFISISNSLNSILDSLNLVLGDIEDASSQVTAGSRQVSDGSQTLSQGTTEQAASIEELTASVSEVASKTKENAASAGEASDLTLTVKQSAEQGNLHMKQMLAAMDEINESSSNISKIIKVIDDIAFQTNILALNAAVEAARAGQHGKGFAVVAEEVRSLAARSAEAARQTTDLIQGSMKKATGGTEIANSTAKALDQIVKGVGKTADIIAEIARSSNEQASGIAQINTGLFQVSRVVQNNAATAEESAASSEELSGQAEVLKEMVNKFKLRKMRILSGSDTKMLESGNDEDFDPMPDSRIVIDENEYDKY